MQITRSPDKNKTLRHGSIPNVDLLCTHQGYHLIPLEETGLLQAVLRNCMNIYVT